MPENKPRKIIVLGSTGSIGLSTLEVVRMSGGAFKVTGLAARSSIDALAAQAAEFEPDVIAVGGSASGAKKLEQKISKSSRKKIKILHGPEGVEKLAAWPSSDKIINGLSGAAGIKPTLAAAASGKTLLIANKEALVAAGELIMATAKKNGARILPLDSEHSAIFQCLQGQDVKRIRKLILTASGGPFLNRRDLAAITPEQALKHPRWDMGAKVSIDSATLVNKGLEIIEAKWLFGVPLDKIEVVIHPEAIIHSMVEYTDGSVIAQLSNPDMKLPIGYAMHYPRRALTSIAGPDFAKIGKLTFQKPDIRRFPCLEIMRASSLAGGLAPAMVAAADEIAVEAFLNKKIGFMDIPAVLENALIHATAAGAGKQKILLGEISNADAAARKTASQFINRISRGRAAKR